MARKRKPEITFQTHIAEYLVREHKYGVLEQTDITDTEHFIAEDQLWAFLKASQADTLKKLVDEHRLIKRWVAVIPGFIENLDVATEYGRELVRQGIDFIQSYADKYHHAKEEAILFKYFDENLDIIKIMLADHENARGRVREMLSALDKRDDKTIASHLLAYRDLLIEHIKKEDEVLYWWMDRNLSTRQVGELFNRFREKDEESGGTPEKYEELISKLERIFKNRRNQNERV